MLIQANSQNLSQVMPAMRRIKDTDQLEERISEAWLNLQQNKDELKQLKVARNFTFATPEQDLENILQELQAPPSGLSDLHEVHKELANLEKTEISLLVLESLMNLEPCRVHQVWMKVFQVVDSHWQREVGRSAEKLFLHLLKQDLIRSLDFLEGVCGSFSADYRMEWISYCADLAANHQELYEALPCSGETAAAQLRRELSYRKFLNNEKIEGREDLMAILERLDRCEPDVWARLLEMVAESRFSCLKQKAWKVWLNQDKNEPSFHNAWSFAVRLLKEAEVKDVVVFYKSRMFAKLIASPEGLALYDPVYACARKSLEDFSELVLLHLGFMKEYPLLRDQRESATLAKLNGKCVTSPALFKGILDDLEKGIIGGPEVWSKVLEKVEICKFPDVKKRTWELWLLHYNSLKEEKTYGKIWQEAINLMEAGEGVEFFCGPNFAAALQTLIKSNALIPIYKKAASTVKKSAADLPRILKAHQTHLDACPVLKNPVIFETALQLINECHKTNPLIAYQLIQHYAKDPQSGLPVLTGACQWLQDRLKGEMKKAIIPAVQELAEVFLELSDKNPEAINCYALADKLNASGLHDLALRFVFKAFYEAANEKKVYQKRLDACFDLMTVIQPKASEGEFLNLLKTVKIKDYQNSYCQKMQEKWIKELALRSSNIPGGLTFIFDFWKFLKNSLESVLTERIIEQTQTILPQDNNPAIENYEEAYTELCTKIANTLQEKITYKMEDGYRAPVLRSLDVFVGHFGELAKRDHRHSFLLLTVACNLVKDSERLKDFMETQIAAVLANTCLKQVGQITDSAMMDTPGIQSFLLAARELFNAMKMEEDKKNLSSLTAIYAPALYKAWLEADASDNFIDDFIKFNEIAYSIIRGDEQNLAVKKLAWKFAVNIAVKNEEDIGDEIWNENLIELMKLIDEMLAAGVCQNRVPLSHLDNVIEICDFAAPLISKLGLDYGDSVKDEMIAALVKMADLQINYRSTTLEMKNKVFKDIVKIAIDEVVETAFQDTILQFAMDVQRNGPRREMRNGVKIDGYVFSASDDDPRLKRKGVLELFHYLMEKSLDSFNALELASELLKRNCFEEFRNDDHCDEMLQIFVDVMIGMDEYDESEMIEYDIYRNVFHALTHNFNSLEELIGTQNAECRKKAQKRLNDIIAIFFKLCGKDGKHLSQVKSIERQSLCISCFEKFLGDCETKQFLEPLDLNKWQAQFALIKAELI